MSIVKAPAHSGARWPISKVAIARHDPLNMGNCPQPCAITAVQNGYGLQWNVMGNCVLGTHTGINQYNDRTHECVIRSVNSGREVFSELKPQ